MLRALAPAILAVITTLLLALGPGRLAEPLAVSFRLADGARVRGMLTEWSLDGIDGSFGDRRWDELMTSDAWTLHRRVMDRSDPADWINLGRVMLLLQDDKRSDAAFGRAVQLDPRAETGVAEARESVKTHFEAIRDAQAAAAAQRLRTEPPEAHPWPASPWPMRSSAQQAPAIATMKADAAEILKSAGLGLNLVQSRSFLIFSETPKADALRWAIELELLVRDMTRQLRIPENVPPFWGKAVIIAVRDRDAFELIEAEAFNQLLPRNVRAACHCVGPKVFIVVEMQPDMQVFRADMLQQAAHGVMHGYRTPRRLPPWANDGLARAAAARAMGGDWPREKERADANAFIRDDGDVPRLLTLSYTDGWPGPDDVGPPIGQRLVELMMSDNPDGFRNWIDAVKTGAEWPEALQEHYGIPPRKLIDQFVQFVGVND